MGLETMIMASPESNDMLERNKIPADSLGAKFLASNDNGLQVATRLMVKKPSFRAPKFLRKSSAKAKNFIKLSSPKRPKPTNVEFDLVDKESIRMEETDRERRSFLQRDYSAEQSDPPSGAASSADYSGDTHMHMAVRRRDMPTLTFLIDLSADVNAVNSDGETALHLAVRSRFADGVRQLARYADLNLRDGVCGDTSLHLAAKMGDVEVTKALLEAERSIDFAIVNNDGVTALEVMKINYRFLL